MDAIPPGDDPPAPEGGSGPEGGSDPEGHPGQEGHAGQESEPERDPGQEGHPERDPGQEGHPERDPGHEGHAGPERDPGRESGPPADDGGTVDPWPARCELVALALAVADLLLIAGVVGSAVALKSGALATSGSISALDRLRYVGYQLGPFNAFLLLAATLLLALDGITAGERRPPSTTPGTAARWTAGTLAAIGGLSALIRTGDIIGGHAIPGAPSAATATSLPLLSAQVAAVLLSAASLYVAFALLDDDALQPENTMEADE